MTLDLCKSFDKIFIYCMILKFQSFSCIFIYKSKFKWAFRLFICIANTIKILVAHLNKLFLDHHPNTRKM